MERPEDIWFLLSRSLSGEASPQEKAALMQALQEQPALMQQYELLQRLWQPRPTADTEGITDRVNQILQRSATAMAAGNEAPLQPFTETTLPSPTPVRKLLSGLRKWGWAAAVAGFSCVLYWQARDNQPRANTGNEVVAQKGSKTRTLLPDGSTVWLNAGSSITYDPAFAGNIREVTLQGEGYFDIVKQAGKPFIVHAGDINIRVLGTAFNVKSYAEEPTIETTLIRGMVQITRNSNKAADPILLHPNQKIVLTRTEQFTGLPIDKAVIQQLPAAKPAIVDLDSNLKESEHIETAWLYNRLEFRGDSFGQLAKKLERWYNITIHFQDEQVRDLVFNGSLENETPQQAFQALTIAVPFQFEIKGNEVYIRSH